MRALLQPRGNAIVVEQPERGEGKRSGVIVGHLETGVPKRQLGRRSSHRDHGETPCERIEHFDGQPACGAPWDPSQVGRRMGELTSAFAVEPAEANRGPDAQTQGLPNSRGRVRFRGHEQTSVRSRSPQPAQGLKEMLPTLISIEVSGVEANRCVEGKPERRSGLRTGRLLGDRSV
ncbi:MAG: hypothetical protein WBM46_18490, partial [Polyangiales bacterium]